MQALHRPLIVSAVAVALVCPVQAQQQQVRPPVAVYWMSVETAAGMGMPGLPAGLGGLMSPSMAGGKRIKLDLGSSRAASAEPSAAHAVPAVLAMGASLPLVTPRTERAPSGTQREYEESRAEQRPKGRMLVYWGCSETVRPGQPLVFDFGRMDPVEAGKVFRSRSVSRPAGPAPGRNRTYGAWPNAQNSTPVPVQASLRGDHAVAGNYSPEIRFGVSERHDFMDPVAFESVVKTPAGAYSVKWKAIPTAIGYFATAMGQGENEGDVVMWSASEVQEFGSTLMDYVPPAEVNRLIREKVLLSPQTTECAVPAGAFRGQGAMLQFIAYGDELNLVHPPRPTDPKITWEQEWALKLRLKSTGGAMLAESEGGGGRTRAQSRERPSGASQQPSQRESAAPPEPRAPGAADAVKEGINVLRGIFGR